MSISGFQLRIRQVVLLLVAWALPATVLCGAEYEFVNLGTFGGRNSRAYDINNRGQVTGWASSQVTGTILEYDWFTQTWIEREVTSNPPNAFLYDNGTMINIGREDEISKAYAINESTRIVGSVGSSNERAFRTHFGPLDETNELGFLDGAVQTSVAKDVNDRGQIIGNTYDGEGYAAFVYEKNEMRSLGNLLAAPSHVRAINNNGLVAGDAYTESRGTGPIHAIIHDVNTGVTQDLGLLASSDWAYNIAGELYANKSHAFAINDAGHVVGESYIDRVEGEAYPYQHAFFWDGSEMVDLGTLPGAILSAAYDINEYDDIVGRSGQRAFLYRDGEMLDLNSLIDPNSEWTLAEAWGINDLGQIVGFARNSSSDERAFLLNPLGEDYANGSDSEDGPSLDVAQNPDAGEYGLLGQYTYSLDLTGDLAGLWPELGFNADPQSLAGTFSPRYFPEPVAEPVPEPATLVALVFALMAVAMLFGGRRAKGR